MAVRPAKTQISLGIRQVYQSLLCAQWLAKHPRFLHADSEDSDQSGRMSRLIWVFAGLTLMLCIFRDASVLIVAAVSALCVPDEFVSPPGFGGQGVVNTRGWWNVLEQSYRVHLYVDALLAEVRIFALACTLEWHGFIAEFIFFWLQMLYGLNGFRPHREYAGDLKARSGNLTEHSLPRQCA